MTYVLAHDARALSAGFEGLAGQHVHRGMLPAGLFDNWLADGVIVAEQSADEPGIDALRQQAKEAGIPGYWNMKPGTLRERLGNG